METMLATGSCNASSKTRNAKTEPQKIKQKMENPPLEKESLQADKLMKMALKMKSKSINPS